MENDDTSKLSLLGSEKTTYTYEKPTAEMLEVFPYTKAGVRDTEVILTFPEFTSLCPKTGQPDFATILVKYIPKDLCVESKSLKLYYFAYRQYGSFMETIANKILDDLVSRLQPKWMEVTADFAPRGGLKIVPVSTYGTRS